MTVDDLIKLSESCRAYAYDDSTGHAVPAGGVCLGTLTIGYGHTGPDVYPGQVITPDEAERLFQDDKRLALLDSHNVLTKAAGSTNCWYMLGAARQAALADMAFNLGRARLAEFTKLLAALMAGNWQEASDQVLYREKPAPSKWRREVGSRAVRDAAIFLSGTWPE